MRNSLKAVLFGASVMFSAGLHAETHQHGDMNTSDASVQQVIKAPVSLKTLI
ncbi:hypothetical protein BANRA_05404 [Escherichia coli]|nr:hypothetical protein BANRA_05404 [Escherichia coli]